MIPNFESMNPTAAAENDLLLAKTLSDFLKKIRVYMLDLTLSEYLMLLLRQKKLKRADVVRDSGLEKAYVYQIFNGEKKPTRDKLIAIAFGLHLNRKETQRMLKIGGCSELYARQTRDAIILFAIHRGMNIWETDDFLADNGLPTIHDPDK